MQFNSYEFLLLFLPVTVFLYFAANRMKPLAGKAVLIGASLIFYCLGRANMLVYLGISVVLNYLFAGLIRKTRVRKGWLLAVPVVINVALLAYCKYLNFAIANVNALLGTEFPPRNLVLPLGISFYTFQQIAYVVAVWRGDLKKNSLADYLAYILYFPKIVMGPLADPVDFISQLNQPERKRFSTHQLAVGLKLLSLGLIKKVLIGDTFARAMAWAHGNVETFSSVDGLLMMLFFMFQLYFDFSGYCDMAVGVSAMLNIDLPMNFDSPYKAVSIRDFWKRWHLTLTGFLTRYIYFPLGGSRKGKLFTYLNTIVVFVISGLWHGASWSFVVWGFLNGVLSCLDRVLDPLERRIPKPVRQVCTFTTVTVLCMLFDLGSVRLWLRTLLKILRMEGGGVSPGLMNTFQSAGSRLVGTVLHLDRLPFDTSGLAMWAFTLVAAFVCFVPENNYRMKDRLSRGSLLPVALCFAWGLLCLGAESAFVYFGF